MKDEITKKKVKKSMTEIQDKLKSENYDAVTICIARESFKMLCVKLGIDTKFL